MVTDSSIVALNANAVPVQVIHHPSLDERLLRILNPNVAFSREVIFALDALDRVMASGRFLGLDE